jgi:hypothetical protein
VRDTNCKIVDGTIITAGEQHRMDLQREKDMYQRQLDGLRSSQPPFHEGAA